MCGRYNIVDSLEVRALLTMLGVDLGKGFRFSPDIAPGATVSIIREVDGERIVSDAICGCCSILQRSSPITSTRPLIHALTNSMSLAPPVFGPIASRAALFRRLRSWRAWETVKPTTSSQLSIRLLPLVVCVGNG